MDAGMTKFGAGIEYIEYYDRELDRGVTDD